MENKKTIITGTLVEETNTTGATEEEVSEETTTETEE